MPVPISCHVPEQLQRITLRAWKLQLLMWELAMQSMFLSPMLSVLSVMKLCCLQLASTK